jgi:ArsR family transcriptional regulator
MNDKYRQSALLLKALSDPNRLLILDYLTEGEQCGCKILEQLRISQPTLSHHMRILYETDLVYCRREGKWSHYSLNKIKFTELKELMETFANSSVRETSDCK